MKVRALLSLLMVSAVAVQACGDSTGGGTGLLTVRLTDAPFPFSEVERVDVHIVRIDARTTEPSDEEAEDADDMSEWTTIATPNATINLLDLAGGVTTNLGQATLPTGIYDGFRLIIDPSQSSVTLKDGTLPEVKWPSAHKTGIKVKLDEPISLTENGSVMVVDFDVGRSFVLRGNSIRNNGLLFKPVVRGTATDITGGASGVVRGDSTGGVLIPEATVEVLKDGVVLTDTVSANIVATTKTDANGAFTFGFLLPGAYELRATAPTGSVYKPALLVNGFNVTTGQTTSGLLVVLPK
ncbi:MAG: DUF4382 domain-containing protein [Gemmatimonadaceae bacterium]